MSEIILTVDRVSKAFRIPSVRRETVREHVLQAWRRRRFDTLTVLDQVEFEVRRGETLGVMGRNGGGKSTLLRIVCGVYPPDSGCVVVKAGLTPILELGVGWNPELDALDNICLVGTIMGMSLRDIRSRIDRILAFAELERFANTKLRHYSSGMAARLGYAIAFETVQDVLVLDEIFAVGDAGFRDRCAARYLDLRAQGHTVLLVSHDPNIIGTFCDRAVLLDGGKITAGGRPDDVVARYLDVVAATPSTTLDGTS